MTRRRPEGRFYVGDDPRTWPNGDSALSVALTFATRDKSDRTYYVKEVGRMDAYGRVTRSGTLVTIERLREAN